MRLDERQLATVLAALRLFQACMKANSWPDLGPGQMEAIGAIQTDSDTLDPLSERAIDELCEELNCGGWRSVSVPGGRKHVRDMHEMLVEERQLLREWADAIRGDTCDPQLPENLRFRADEINKLIEEGLPKKFRKQEGK